MRDPIFYRWHKFIDSIFQTHKNRFNPYSKSELMFDNIVLNAIQVSSVGGKPNILNTHWQESDLNLAKGLDFIPRGDVQARLINFSWST
jgi:tyrosinase